MTSRRDPWAFVYRGHSTVPLGRLNLRILSFFGAMILLIGLAGGLYLQQASEVAGYAHEIRMLERDKEQLHRQLVSLRAQVAMMGSLARLLEEGERLGYSLPDAADSNRRLIVEHPPLEAPPEAPPQRPVAADERATAPGGLWQRLVQPLQEWMAGPDDDAGP